MRKVIGCLLGICLAVSAQAVTVKWSIPSGDYTSEAGIYFVYSETQVTDYDAFYTSTKDISAGTASGNYTKFTSSKFLSDGISAYGKDDNIDATAGSGYYYLMVFSTKDTSLYAVAGGTKYVTGGSNGIYEPSVDGAQPETGTYLPIEAFIGGNWTAATVPEPTLLSLLAFGVAGLALRRKSHC